jgi:FtsP/CotA-like multicopper oxidase with cupredoxin domain
MPRTTRRAARAGLLAALLALAAPAPALAEDEAPAPWAPVSGLPLAQPPQLHAEDGILRVTLDAERGAIDVSGSPVMAQPFNGSIVGPTLRVRPGDTIEVTFRNATPDNTNIHFHGLHVSPRGRGDNVFRTFAPGSTMRSRVTLPRDHSPGTYWYHAHFHGLTDPQVMGGMSGLIVVEGLERLLPEDLRGIPQRQVALRDLQTVAGQPGMAALSGEQIDPQSPTTRLVNGRLMPRARLASGRTELWRLANIGSDLFYKVQLTGHRFRVLAEDGSPAWRVRRAGTLVMPPGKRFDVLVEPGRAGSYALRTLAYPQEGFETLPQVDLMDVEVAASERPRDGRAPRRLAAPAGPITDEPIAKRRRFTFSFGSGKQFTARINGAVFDPSTTNVAPVVGTVEEWTLRNVTSEEHPFHIHVNDFQVVSVNGRPYRARSLQDVVIIPKKADGKAGEVVIRVPFEDFTGHFVFHCHILGHEDAGMMFTVQVRRPGEKVTPPPGAHGQHASARGVATAGVDRARQWALVCRLRRGHRAMSFSPARSL